MILKMNFENHVKPLLFSLPIILIVVITSVYLRFDVFSIIVGLLVYLIFLIPSLYLHLEYYFKNRDEAFEILEDKIIIYKRGGEIVKKSYDDLIKVILYKSANLDKGGIPLTPIESYHYARIIPKQGEDIIITCLVAPNLDDVLKRIKVPFERKKRFFSSLKGDFI